MKRLLSFLTTVLITAILPISAVNAAPSWLDQTHTIFLPPEMGEKLGATQSFPLFWWNFLVLEESSDSPEKVRALCQALRDAPDSPLAKIPCGSDLGSFLPLIRDWSRDYPLRHIPPSREAFLASFRETFSQATLPLGKEVLTVLREDPFGSYRDLRLALESQVMMDLPREGGVFVDRVTRRVVLPLQFRNLPTDTAPTEHFYEILQNICTRMECPKFTLVGPHASTHLNERQVMRDLRRVSVLGLILTLAQVAFLIFTRRSRALWLFPPVILAIGISTALTVFLFGSIHGLTLSFGMGLIGLAIDYGLHSAFNMQKRGVWRANLCGIVTTLCGFGVLYFSDIPLIRQLMTFSLLGILTAGALFYLLHTWRGEYFSLHPLAYEPIATRPKTLFILVLLIASVPAAFLLRPNLSMTQFDFQRPHDTEVRNWLYPRLGATEPLIDIENSKDLRHAVTSAHERQAWADQNDIPFQSIARFLPSPDVSDRNRQAWANLYCSDRSTPISALNASERQFFAPALAHLRCEPLRNVRSEVPAYLQDFQSINSGSSFISLWFPPDSKTASQVREAFPEIFSLREVANLFPETLAKELRWMIPLSVLLASFFLFFYYRRLRLTLLALLPFFSAVGSYAIAAQLFSWDFSFISLIGLIMVFAFSLDYGVFAVDITLEPEGRSVNGVWTCLLFAGVSTVLGFAPLMACEHPVLIHLGQTLTLGTLGTLMGTLWGIPGIAKLVGFPKEIRR